MTGELKRTASWHSFGGEGSPAGASADASEDDASAVRQWQGPATGLPAGSAAITAAAATSPASACQRED